MLESFLRILDRQGRLSGDLNWTQRTGLAWIMNRESQDDVTLERMRAESTALASNPQTSTKYIQHLMKEREKANSLEADIEDGDKIPWQTPTSVEEVKDVLQNLGLRIPSVPWPKT